MAYAFVGSNPTPCTTEFVSVKFVRALGKLEPNMVSKEPLVDEYIKSLPDWQQAICRSVRSIVHRADPEVIEIIKFTNRPYFVLDGNVCALLAAKDHVNVFIYDPIAPDPEGIINQGHGNKTARAIQIYQGDNINEQALLNLIQAIIASNRAGGWRKLSNQ